MTTEEWRPVVGYEGIYEVSDAGRVRRPLKTSTVRSTPGRVLRPALTNSGYLYVNLYGGAKPSCVTIHTTVAAAFLGPRPDGAEVNHRNTIKTDNRADNLEYLSIAEHAAHTKAMGRTTAGDRNGSRTHPERLPRGEQHVHARLSDADVRVILTLLPSRTQRSIAQEFGVVETVIGKIARNKAWRHISREGAGDAILSYNVE